MSSTAWTSMEELFIICGLVLVQIMLAIFSLLLKHFLALGINSLFFVIFGNLAGALYLLPFAVVLEKKKWPTRLRTILMVQIALLALLGTAFQAFLLLGIKKTSPALASVMPNLAPGIIFIIAVCVRFEKFSMSCIYSRTKVLGTIVCLTGAIAMSFFMSPSSTPVSLTSQGSSDLTDPVKEGVNLEWISGCFYTFASVLCLSCQTILQAAAMVEFPSPFSLCVLTSLISSVMTALLQIVMEGKLDAGSSSLSLTSIAGVVLLGAVVTTACNTYQAWCVNKKGPVVVSIFSPIQTVCSAALSAMFLGQIFSLPSLTGMVVMFVGLYIVLWAKKKENSVVQDAEDNVERLIDDSMKPLLTEFLSS